MAKPSKTKPPKPARASSGQGPLLWWGGLGSGALLMFSPATAMLLAAALSPVLLVALTPEDGQGGRVVRASFAFGLAASLHPLRLLWEQGASVSDAIALARQAMVLGPCWIAILAGWFTAEAATLVLRLVADVAAATERRRLAASLAELEEEWGPLPSLSGPPA